MLNYLCNFATFQLKQPLPHIWVILLFLALLLSIYLSLLRDYSYQIFLYFDLKDGYLVLCMYDYIINLIIFSIKLTEILYA
jgi:hypothetical protein